LINEWDEILMAYRSQNYTGTYTRTNKTTGQTSVNTVISDTVTENRSEFRRRKPKGWLNPTPYSLSYSFNRGVVGTAEIANDIVQGAMGRLGGHEVMNALPLPGNARNDAIIKMLASLKDQSVNYGVALAEAQQTANLVGSTASRLARACSQLKRRNIKGALGTLGMRDNARDISRVSRFRKVPDQWLEMQYGWKPLLGDVDGAMKELARYPRQSWRQSVTGSVSATDGGSIELKHPVAGRVTYVYQRRTGIFIRCDFLPGNDFAASMSRTGLTNPFEILWEKVPFSFVADWFLPVGDFLSSLDATIGWTFGSGSESRFSRQQVLCKKSASNASRINGSYVAVTLNRSTLGSSPLPHRPGLKNPLSLGHMANGLALLNGAFRRR
jgi:hypothetical protein